MSDLLYKHYNEVVKPTWNYAGRITTADGHWSNAALGLTGEAGETGDNIKKMLFHTEGKDYKEKIRSELGDVMYYWLQLVSLGGFTVEEVLEYNRKKLESRHPELGKVSERFGKDHLK